MKSEKGQAAVEFALVLPILLLLILGIIDFGRILYSMNT
jgi:Flp pilus assembly protein TadG